MKLNQKQKNAAKIICLIVIGAILFSAYSYLFISQIITDDGSYFSDIKQHMEIAYGGRGYSFLYRFMELLYNMTGEPLTAAFLSSAMMVGTWFAAAKLIDVLYERKSYFTSALIALPPMFVTGIFIPKFYEFFYRRQLVTQPYHNITYIGMRLFAVLAILVFYKVFETYLQKIKWHQWLLLAAMLVLSTAIKPSFFYGFALTLLLFLIIDFIRTRFKLKPFWQMVILGCVVFPSIFIMYLQASILYSKPVEDGGSSIILIWGMNFVKHGFTATALKILCSLSFPALVGALNLKKLKKTEIFIYVMYAVQLVIVMLFVESGPRANDGNFYWGLYCAAFFIFIIAFARFFNDLIHYKERNKLCLCAEGALAAAHIICGLAYFSEIMSGRIYGI